MSAPRKAAPKKRTRRADDRPIARGPWYVSSYAAAKADELTCVRMGPVRPEFNNTRLVESWWDVQPAKINYCHVHWTHGRALAFDIIDALRNPDGDMVPSQLGATLSSMVEWAHRSQYDLEAMKGIAYGFGSVLGEYIQRHNASR